MFMTRRDDTIRLQHLLDASMKALEFTRGRTRADLDREEMLTLARVRLLQSVGEAARDVSFELKEAHPEIPLCTRCDRNLAETQIATSEPGTMCTGRRARTGFRLPSI